MINLPSLDSLKTKKTPASKKSPSSTEAIQLSGKVLKKIAMEYGCTETEFKTAFADTVGSTLEEIERGIKKLSDSAKGFLDQWGALFLMAHEYEKVDMFSFPELKKQCERFLKIENKLPRKKGEKIVRVKDDPPKKAPNKGKPQLSSKLKDKAPNIGIPSEESIPEEPSEEPSEEEPKSKKKLKIKDDSVPFKRLKTPSKTRQKSYICIFNGGEGSGKSRMAQTFPTPFTIDLEDKLFDLIEYDSTLDLKEGNIDNIQTDDDYVVAVVFDENADIDYIQTDENIEKAIEWYRKEGWKNHETLIIDVGKAIRESSVRAEETKKGRQLGQFEYIPITKGNKSLIIPLVHFCRQNGRNLIIITHWSGIYETRKNAQGFDENVKIGREPDVKEWLRDLVTWRIDFLKPDESGFDEKFIVDFQKAPGKQYFKLDITDKNLFEIISDKERLAEEQELFRRLRRKAMLAQQEAKK